MNTNTQELIDGARARARATMHGPILIALADALEREATDRVHAEEALRRYGSTAQEAPEPAAGYHEDALKVTAVFEGAGIFSVTLPIRPDADGQPGIEAAFAVAQDVIESGLMLASAAAVQGPDADIYDIGDLRARAAAAAGSWGA